MSEQCGDEYNILFQWDAEASVWIATSEDIIGLVLEDENLKSLNFKIQNAVPELLKLNHQSLASRIKCYVEGGELVSNG